MSTTPQPFDFLTGAQQSQPTSQSGGGSPFDFLTGGAPAPAAPQGAAVKKQAGPTDLANQALASNPKSAGLTVSRPSVPAPPKEPGKNSVTGVLTGLAAQFANGPTTMREQQKDMGITYDNGVPQVKSAVDVGSAYLGGNVVSDVAKDIGNKEYGEAAQKVLTTAGLMKAGHDVGTALSDRTEAPAKPSRFSVESITGTTPERIAELKTLPDRVEAVRQTVVNAEKAAHQAAKDAFPKFEKPIETGKMIEQDAAGPVMLDEWGEVKPRALVPETTTFEALQEQRSKLLQDITEERKAVAKGAAPRYDLVDMLEQLHKLDDVMNKAALDEGGPEGLAKLQAARTKFGQYMQDFHNQGSPLEPLVRMKPGETAKVVSHLTSPDNGARTLETLRKYGVDTKQIGQLLQGGERPLRVGVNEAAKLRKAGSDAEYTKQRYRESISQLETQDMPTRAEARLPKNAQASQYPSVVGKLAKQAGITPKSVTKFRIKHALKKLDGKP